jgi:selenocysteine lyase/cysteine desulfurase
VDVDEVVFIQNATTGIGTVLRNIEFEKGDVVIMFETIYGGFEKAVQYITETTPAESVKIAFTYPVSNDWLLEAFRKTIQDVRGQGRNPRLAIFDTVVSNPGVRMPYEKLLRGCHEEKVPSFLDGAQGLGMLSLKDLDLGTLKPDFFTSNLHK